MMLLRVKAKRSLINFIMFSIVLFTVYLASFYSHASNIIGTAKVTADSLNVRSGPGKEYDAMGKLYSGNVVDVKAVEGDWLKIDYNSSDGYISIDYVEYEPDEELVTEEEEEQIKEEAQTPDETAETEDEPSFDYKFLFGLIGAIIVILIMILITIKSIKATDDYDDDDDEEDDDDEDDYYEDEYEEEDEEDDEADDDEYEYVVVKRPRTQKAQNRQKPKSSDDFLIDIDPRYFD